MPSNPTIAPLTRRLAVGLVLFNAIFMLLAGLWLARGFERSQDQAAIASRNMANVLAQSITATFERIDVALTSVVDDYARHHSDRGEMGRALHDLQARLPDIDNMGLTDAEGDIRFLTPLTLAQPATIGDHGCFQNLRDTPEAGLVISEPTQSPVTGKWQIVLARRLAGNDGAFDGVIYAAINLDHLAEMISHLDLGKHGAAALRDDKFGAIARYPATEDGVKAIGQNKISSEFRVLLDANPAFGTYLGMTGYDNYRRVASYRQVGERFHVMVSLAEDDYLETWWSDVARIACVSLLFAAISWLLFRIIVLSWRQNEALWQESRASEARYRGLVESQSEFIVRLDREGSLAFVNGAFARALGKTGKELLGAPWEAFAHGEDVAQIQTAIETAITGPDHRATVEGRLLLPSGPRWVAWEGFGICGPSGAVDEIQAVGRDITDWVEHRETLNALVRELDASNKDLEQFAYVASHDLREPLRMVTSYVDLLARRYGDQLDGDAKEFIGYARDGAKRMEHLILDLLEYSRIGRSGKPKEPVELDAVVRQAVTILGFARDEVNGTVEIGEGLPQVVGHPDDLVRLFQNLIGNAFKYHSPDRRPVVRVARVTKEGAPVIAVEDNGIGIAPEYFERIFGVFQRLHGRGQYEGTGIGLANCKKIVEQHGGQIWVESVPDVGSSFFIALPTIPRKPLALRTKVIHPI